MLTQVKYTVLYSTHLLAHGLGNEVSMFLGSGGHFGTVLKTTTTDALGPRDESTTKQFGVRYGARLENGTIRDCDQQFKVSRIVGGFTAVQNNESITFTEKKCSSSTSANHSLQQYFLVQNFGQISAWQNIYPSFEPVPRTDLRLKIEEVAIFIVRHWQG